MKYVKEHIDEKFTEDSDPIRDMGIGIEYKLKQWCKEQHISFDDKDEVLFQCVSKKQQKFVKYLISIGIDTKGRWAPYAALRAAILYNDLKIAKILIDAGSNPRSADKFWITNADKFWITNVNSTCTGRPSISKETIIFIEKEVKEWKKTHRRKNSTIEN